MAVLVADCPRCNAKHITFDLLKANVIWVRIHWERTLEAFCVCRACNKSTVFVLTQNNPNDDEIFVAGIEHWEYDLLNDKVKIMDYISTDNMYASDPPDYIPEKIEKSFEKGLHAWRFSVIMLLPRCFAFALTWQQKNKCRVKTQIH